MIKKVCVLTKSYKHGGFCVAGIDMENKKWIRFVSSVDPNEDEIKKEFMFSAIRPITCLDVIKVDLFRHAPNNCQTENWLINGSYRPIYVRTLTVKELIDLVKIDDDKNFIVNRSDYLLPSEIKNEKRSLYIYAVTNLTIDVTGYESFGEVKVKYKCSFDYNGFSYSNISLTDPEYRDASNNGLRLPNALIVASLPCIPYKDGWYYKFCAKIIPIDNEDVETIKSKNSKEQDPKDSGVILCIANQLNPFTKEKITGIDEKLKQRLLEIALKLKP